MTNNLKIFRFDEGAAPRTPEQAVPMESLFIPKSSVKIPIPLTAAMSSYDDPPMIYFFGGTADKRAVVSFSFETDPLKFEAIQATTILEKKWKSDVVAATRYLEPTEQSTELYGFNATHAVRINEAFIVSACLEQAKTYREQLAQTDWQ